jgi:large subunit ribosomal protein L22
MTDVRAIQRTARQSPYKMRLVVDQIRGKGVNEALALLQFSKKHAAHQIAKVLQSAVANAEFRGRASNEPVDVDLLFVKHAVINEGPKLKRFMPAAMGRATPIQKRTSHVEIVVGPRPVRTPPSPPKAAAAGKAPKAAKEGEAEAAPGRRTARATRPASGRARNPKRER